MFVRAYDRELECVSSHRALQQAAGHTPAARRLARKRSPRQRSKLRALRSVTAFLTVKCHVKIDLFFICVNCTSNNIEDCRTGYT